MVLFFSFFVGNDGKVGIFYVVFVNIRRLKGLVGERGFFLRGYLKGWCWEL